MHGYDNGVRFDVPIYALRRSCAVLLVVGGRRGLGRT